MHIPAEMQKAYHRLFRPQPCPLRVGGYFPQRPRHRLSHHARHPVSEAVGYLRTRFRAEEAEIKGEGTVSVHGEPYPWTASVQAPHARHAITLQMPKSATKN